LLFGSDFPVLDFNKQRLAVANAKITKEDKQNILLNNASNLLL
jgi:predicted TIM-barrel fold metal-dependent hydrolase